MEIDPKDKERYENLVQCFNFLKQEIKEIEDKLINRALLKSVDELELSARVMNIFKNEFVLFKGFDAFTNFKMRMPCVCSGYTWDSYRGIFVSTRTMASNN